MKTFWVLGKLFKDDHDRAIRYIDLRSANRIIRNDIPKEKERIRPDWCDRCGLYHIIREEAVIITPKTNGNMSKV